MKLIPLVSMAMILCGCSTFTAGVRSVGAYEYSATIAKNITVGDMVDVQVKEGKSTRMGYDVLLRNVQYKDVVRTIDGVINNIENRGVTKYNAEDLPENGNYIVSVDTAEGQLKLSGVFGKSPTVVIADQRRTIVGYSMQPLLLISVPVDIASSVLMLIGGIVVAPFAMLTE